MNAISILLLCSLLLISGTAPAAYRPVGNAAGASEVAARPADTRHGRTATLKQARAERRLHRIMERIHRLLPEDGEAPLDVHALLSFIFGAASLLSLFFFPYLSILAVPALVLGIIGLGKTKPGGLRGRGMAIAGIVLGALTLLLGILAVLLLVLLLIAIF